MKQVLDPSKSKRPQMVPDEKDSQVLHSKIADIGESILQLEELETILNNDADHLKVRKLSKARILQMVERSLDLELTPETLLLHAEIRGQLRERILLTKELSGVRTARNMRQAIQNQLKRALKNMFSKAGKRGE